MIIQQQWVKALIENKCKNAHTSTLFNVLKPMRLDSKCLFKIVFFFFILVTFPPKMSCGHFLLPGAGAVQTPCADEPR